MCSRLAPSTLARHTCSTTRLAGSQCADGPFRPLIQRVTVFINFLKRVRDIIHVPQWSEEDALFEPETLFVTNEVAVRAACFGIVQPGRGFRQKRAERFVSEHRLVVQRKAISGRARDALRLE